MNTKDLIREKTEEVTKLTSSALVAARLAGVTPAQLAVGLADEDANADYMAALVVEVVKTARIQEKEEAKKNNR